MTDKHQPHDDLFDEDREAELRYSKVRAERKDAKGRTGPLPVTGQTDAATTNGAAAQPAQDATIIPFGQARDVAGLSSVGVMAAGAEVRFGDEPLRARGIDTSEDPWGAYDNPENIPGLTLDDDDERQGEDATSMAIRGSGTRGDRKKRGGGMNPMMPMAGGAGAGAGGAGGQGGGATSAPGGPSGGMTLPAATVGGVGGQQTLAAQQAATYQQVMQGAQQGQVSIQSMSGLASTRASGAMFSPPASGVTAAGGEAMATPITDPKLLEMMRNQGSDGPFVVGPDGNLYENPNWRASAQETSGIHGPGAGVGVRGADLDGDGVVSQEEFARWQSGEGRTVHAEAMPASPIAGTSAPASWTGTSPAEGVRNVVDALQSATHQAPIGSAASGAIAQAGSVVRDVVGKLNDAKYQPASGPGGASGGSFGGGARDFVRATAGAVTKLAGTAAANVTDFSMTPSELQSESKLWDGIAQRQAALARMYESLVGDLGMFGVMNEVLPSYETMRHSSVSSTQLRRSANAYTSTNLSLSAEELNAIEQQNSQLAKKEIP
ncbi:hypothetical protein [uncultured Tessaracoccus sp.]|uniref:hypothetical protein n=1 Tax=uncultured Tessaracoccus sp. TaxID=905023 RepID=UPI0025F94949|nr:hypothetical protein [uncultured Tessaracoccus sp.]